MCLGAGPGGGLLGTSLSSTHCCGPLASIAVWWEQGVTYNVGKFPYMANSRAKTNGESPTNSIRIAGHVHARHA